MFSGADMNIEQTLAGYSMGFLGEETVADTNLVWITKTHYPLWCPGGGKKFRSQKQIVIVRNPIDALPSMAIMGMTSSNSVVPNEKLHEDFPEFWDGFLKFMAP